MMPLLKGIVLRVDYCMIAYGNELFRSRFTDKQPVLSILSKTRIVIFLNSIIIV